MFKAKLFSKIRPLEHQEPPIQHITKSSMVNWWRYTYPSLEKSLVHQIPQISDKLFKQNQHNPQNQSCIHQHHTQDFHKARKCFQLWLKLWTIKGRLKQHWSTVCVWWQPRKCMVECMEVWERMIWKWVAWELTAKCVITAHLRLAKLMTFTL